MTIFQQLEQAANYYRNIEQYRIASMLCSVAVDVALHEDHKLMISHLRQARSRLKFLQAQLAETGLSKLANQVDVIAKDIESKIISFSELDPIASILDSYKIIHRVASVGGDPIHSTLQELNTLIDHENFNDNEIAALVKRHTLGLSPEDKKKIVYTLEKEHNLTLDKVAFQNKLESDMPPSKQDNQKKCLDKAKTMKEREECLFDKEKEDNQIKMFHSWPPTPSMWGGFAYQTPVPYQQSNQMNFWSLAKNKQKLLNRIAKKP